MPGKPQTAQTLKVVSVEEKEYDKKKDGVPTGEKGKLWNITFEPIRVGDVIATFPSSTFSSTAAAELEKLVGSEARFTLEEGRPFKNVMQYNLMRIEGTDGTVIYEPGMDKRGGGGGGGWKGSQRPDWSYEDPEERRRTRQSIEAQVALKAAIETLGALIQYDESVSSASGALDFVAQATERYIPLLAKASTEKSGSGSRLAHRSSVGGVGGSNGTGSGSHRNDPSADSAGSTTPAEAPAQGSDLPATPARHAPTEQNRPSPGPDSSADGDTVLSQAIAFFEGDLTSLQKAYKLAFNKPPALDSMTDDELKQLMGAGVDA